MNDIDDNEPLAVHMAELERRIADPECYWWYRLISKFLLWQTRRFARRVGEEILYCRPSAFEDTMRRRGQ